MKMLNFGIPFDSKTNQNKKDMKKIFRFAAMVAAAAALFSCQEPVTPDPGTGDENQGTGNTELNVDIKFTLAVEEVECDKAKIKVEHDGARTDTWYGFVTTESDIDQAIDNEVAALVASGKVSLQKSTSKTVTVRGLEPETAYTYVVFGLSDQGQVYGEPVSVDFTTAKAPVVIEGYQVNPNWTVAYIGAGVVNGESYDHVISVTSTDETPYLTTVVAKTDFESYGIEAIAESEIAYWTDYVNRYNEAYGTSYDLSALLYVGSVEEGWTLDAGEYVALAIGADASNAPTGYYAVSEPFSVVEEEMTEAYAAWLGNWTFTDSEGVALNVTFGAKSNNKTYNMFGFDAPDLDAYPVEVTWMADYEMWVIYPQNFGTFTFTDNSQGDIYFLGGQQGEKGFSLYTDVPVCLGGFDAEGNRLVVGYSDEESGINMTLMSHFVVIGGTPYFWAEPETLPWFPMSITAATQTSALSTEKAITKWTSKKTMLSKPIKFSMSAVASF